MLTTPELKIEPFVLDQTELANRILEQIRLKVPNATYTIKDNDIVFNIPSGKMNLPVKVINGRFYTNKPEFEQYISQDRKSINYTPYQELFNNINIEL